jgi:pimeloyl-ACP methyl ester carboxylesterase
MHHELRDSAPHAPALLSTAEGRRRAAQLIASSHAHIPLELLADQLLGAAICDVATFLECASRMGYDLDAASISCRVRVVWGTDDRLLPWPSAAVRFREEWLPNADWVVLDGVGHCPQLDVPLEAAQLVVGFTDP